MIEQIKDHKKIISIIIRSNYSKNGVSFFTPNDFSQQLAFMKHSKGKSIESHLHNKVERNVFFTQEVLFIKRGKLRVDFYDNEKKYLESRVLNSGDVILLASGGHGFEVLEDLEMFEVKQGPYAGNNDKIRFNGILKSEVILKD
ncbi:hypothetical protein GF385_00105 [Candidatus Dependentiae bacterium]|nr:hypothetical protein [Candidatus Dependentiae bacterium]